MKKVNESMTKLLALTKRLKQEKIKIASLKPERKHNNKWRSEAPKFSPKAPSSDNLVQGGGMKVDASRQEEYDAWRKAKTEERNPTRIQRRPL